MTRTGVIFYTIPPFKTEGEVDQRRLRGGRLSSLFCCGAALGTSRGWLAAAGALKLRETKSPHKAGHGGWRQDFFLLFRRRANGGRKELARGNQSNHFQGCSGRHTDGQGCRQSTKSRAQSTSSSRANHSQSCQRIHLVHQTKILMPSLFCPLSRHNVAHVLAQCVSHLAALLRATQACRYKDLRGISCPTPPLKLW